MSNLDDLRQIGFKRAGVWISKDDDGIIYEEDKEFTNDENALYALVVEEDVRYVGKTARTIRDRMRNYEYADSSQKTNIKIKGHIKDLHEKGKIVKVYSLIDDGLIHFGRFHLNLAAGLEDDIINKLAPEWNEIGT